jgi:DNA repair exonuclease SbcCD ATPase subunit
MQITQLSLKNFRCFPEASFEFKSGVTGIIGLNGSGKSSIIEALTFLFVGEGYDDKKDLMLTGTNGQSYVQGKFILNGKEGILTRHIDSSKVHLNYDGATYHKATEVKDLWAKLLQIDGHIFKHVIVGRQNQIPELFSGDSSVREKVFQKIFMVPNTERLRAVIWDNYIKNAPPPLPEEDVVVLNSRVTDAQAKLAQLTEHRQRVSESLLDEGVISRILNSLEYYKRCIADAQLKPRIEASLADFKAKLAAANSTLEKINKECDQDKLTQLGLRAQQIMLDKDRYKRKSELVARITAAESKLTVKSEEEFTQLSAEFNKQQTTIAALTSDKAIADNRLDQLAVEFEGYHTLSVNPTCPTCGQAIANVQERLNAVQQEIVALSERNTVRTNLIQAARAESDKLNAKLAQRWDFKNCEKLRQDLQVLEASKYDETEDRQVNNELGRLVNLTKQVNELNLTVVCLTGEIAVANEKLKGLMSYAGNGSPEAELRAMQEALDINKRRVVEVNELSNAVATVNAELTMLDNQLATSQQNKAKNAQRDKYLSKLRLAYDTLHITRFPRNLIQTYRGTLEEELGMQLQRFDLPYLIRINDEFKFVVLNPEERVIPALSGGQKMIAGLCLRLALHSLFAQAFPMLVIDEGTTNLDVKKREQYFSCIKNLREQQTIGQVILIDHDEGLIDCVDNVINLTV